MHDELIQQIAEKVTVSYTRLSIVSNPGGLLASSVVRQKLLEQERITVVAGSNLQLRVHFELTYKHDHEGRYVYVCEDTDSILPDMREDAYITSFSVTDLLPLFANKPLLRRQPYEVVARLYLLCQGKRVGIDEGEWLVNNITTEIVQRRMTSAEHYRGQIAIIDIDWDKPAKTMNSVCTIMNEAIESGAYDGIDDTVEEVNLRFQDWIDQNYFAQLHASPLLSPKSVNGILPYLSHNFTRADKVALIVVDGFSYWQWLLLKGELSKTRIAIIDGTTLAWLPTITMLSRQAIFRGDTPLLEYKQSTAEENRMWRDYWQREGLSGLSVQYISDSDEFAINEGVRRLAYVTVEMDKKMHSSTDYRDLHALTRNWCPRMTEKIKTILSLGYNVFLTTDHGGVLSEGWRRMTEAEKVFLYKDGSRGKRHLIYGDNSMEQQRFYNENTDLSLLNHDHWLAMRNNLCFDTSGTREITHGGSHFLEVVIPFINIKPQ